MNLNFQHNKDLYSNLNKDFGFFMAKTDYCLSCYYGYYMIIKNFLSV